MPKITFIGAGSLVFTRNLCNDILLTPTLQESEIVLMDIDPQRLEMADTIVNMLAEKPGTKLWSGTVGGRYAGARRRIPCTPNHPSPAGYL